MQGRDADAGHDGQQNRGQDDDGGQGFHEGAHDEQQNVDDEQNKDLAVGKAEDGAGDGTGHVFNSHDVAEDSGHGHEDDDSG